MAKPVQLPRWAETAGGVAAANIVEPNEGKKDLGYTPAVAGVGDIPTSGGLNWWMRLVYLWTSWLDAATSLATASALVVRDADGRARFADPADAADADTKGARDTAIGTHNAVTSPHSATSAATASRLVLRDASGRAAVATPSAVGDIATKGYVDGVTSATANNGAAGANWGVTTTGWVAGKLAHVAGSGAAGAGAAWASILTGLAVPGAGAADNKLPGFVTDFSAGLTYPAAFRISGTGVLSLAAYDNGTSMVAPFAIGAGDSFEIGLSYPLG